MAARGGALLRQAMAQGGAVAPGITCGFTARMAVELGFRSVYVSGAAISARSGLPDTGFIGGHDIASAVAEISRAAPQLGILADADTGFGGSDQAAQTAYEYWRAGAGGLQLEDQVAPKRCGHLDGKRCVSPESFAEKVASTVACRDRHLDPAFVVCARTDARAVEGLDAAIARARLYVEAGADMIFPEALASAEEFAVFARALGRGGAGDTRDQPAAAQGARPLLVANMTEFGQSPLLPARDLHALGYDLVLYPVTVFRAAMRAARDALARLRTDGHNCNLVDDIMHRREMYATLDYNPAEPWLYPNPKTAPKRGRRKDGTVDNNQGR